MEENTNSTLPPVPKKNNWLWILAAVAAIVILAYFIFSNLSLFNVSVIGGKSQTVTEQNNNQPAVSNNTNNEENVDSLLNQLDAAEGEVTQALNDTPIDVMSDK